MGVRWRALAVAAAMALVSLRSTSAHAQKPELDVAAAERAYVDLDFDGAARLADAAVRRGGLGHAQLVRAYALLGRAQAVLDHDAEAREAFVRLLTVSPDEKEDRNLPPRVTARMTEARAVVASWPARPGLDVSPALAAGTGGALRVTTRDPTHVVQRLVVGWRWADGGEYVTASPAPGVDVEVPIAPPPSTPHLDYYASAFDDHDNVIFEVGDAAAPKTAFAPIPPPVPVSPPIAPERREGAGGGRSIFASPVFWTVTAGIVACVGTGAYFALRKPREELLAPTSAELGPALFCGSTRCQ